MNITIEVVAAVIIGVLGSARLTRLLVEDAYPPAAWLRAKWQNITSKQGESGPEEGSWTSLITCPWCAAPYIVAANMAWALLTDLQPAWWIANLWLAASYAASWVVYHDED